MKHQPVLSNYFKEINTNNLSKLDYERSNYIPVYSIGFPQWFKIGYNNYDYLINLPDSYKDNKSYVINRLLNYYWNKLGRGRITFNEYSFKELIKANITDIKAMIHSEIDAWLNTPVLINQNINNSYDYPNRNNISQLFLKYNDFNLKNYPRNMIYNYGFLGKYINKEIIPQIVLMTKPEYVNTIKRCFILNQDFPKDIFELWVSPNLDSYMKNLYKGLNGLIIENEWKVFKYDMRGILAGIELPSFKSIRQKNEFEDSSWAEFCNKELAVA